MTESINKNNIFKDFFRMPRFAPAIFAAFLFGLSLLFLKELSQNIQLFFIPSLIIYAQGAALIGALHRFLGLNYEKLSNQNNEKTIPLIWKIVIYLIHIVWFLLLIYYNCKRKVL